MASDLVRGRDGMLCLGEPVGSFLLQHPIESHPLNLSASGLLFCQITSKERETGENDVVMEKELDKSFQEPPVGEIHTPPQVVPNFEDVINYPVNNEIIDIVLEILTSIGVRT